MKIVILEGHAVNPGDLSWDVLNQFGEVTVYPRTPYEQAAERIGDAEIVVINKTNYNAALMDACPSVKLICVLATCLQYQLRCSVYLCVAFGAVPSGRRPLPGGSPGRLEQLP